MKMLPTLLKSWLVSLIVLFTFVTISPVFAQLTKHNATPGNPLFSVNIDFNEPVIDVNFAGSKTVPYSVNFEFGADGWTSSFALGSDTWALETDINAHSATHCWFVIDPADVSDQRLTSPAIALPASGPITLKFWHTYALEHTFDGGVLEISTDGGNTFVDLGEKITIGGYNTTIQPAGNYPLFGQRAWSGGTIGAMTEVSVNLASYAGETIILRFRLGSDNSNNTGGAIGWYIDDISIDNFANTPPVANPQSVETIKGVAKNITLTGLDANGDTLTYQVVDNPTHGLLTGTAPNITYTPSTGYSGPDSFTFKVNDGTVDSPPATVSITVIAPKTVPFVETFEDGPGDWVSGAVSSGYKWILVTTPNARSATHCWYANDPDVTADQGLISPLIQLPSSGPITLKFWHTFNLEEYCDGGTLEISTDGGNTFVDLKTKITSGGYNTTMYDWGYTPVDGKQAWSGGTIGAMTEVVVNLADFSGRTIVLRWRLVSDYMTAGTGWYVDDISIDGLSTTLPVAHSKSVQTLQDDAKDITLTGSDPNGHTLTFQIVDNPTHGLLTGTAPNITYTPATGYSGPDSFTYKVNNGTTDSELATVSITVIGIKTVPYYDTFESANDGWTTSLALGSDNWDRVTNANAHSATHCWFAVDPASVSDKSLTSPRIQLPASGPITLTFWHTYALEHTFDGGVLEVSTDGGNTFFDLGENITIGGYNTSIQPAGYYPLFGQRAWSGGTIGAMTEVSVNLADLAGEMILLRWRLGSDNTNNTGDAIGWYIDDISIENFANTPPIANPQSVETIKDVAKNITLTGSDANGDTLTFQVVDNPTHGELTGTAPNITYTPATGYFGTDSFTFKVNDGKVDSALATVSITIIGPKTVPFVENFESGAGGWTSSAAQGGYNWALVTSGIARSATHCWFAFDALATTNQSLISPIIQLPSSGPITLKFWHTFSLEESYDGGMLEISTNGGNTFVDLKTKITSGGYNTTMYDWGYFDGKQAWSGGTIGAMTEVVVNLANYAGSTIILRWRLVTDYQWGEDGWYIDNISIEGSPNTAPVANPQSVETDKGVAKDITLTGSDANNDTLTFQVVDNPTHGLLTGTAPNITYTPATGYSGPDSFTFKVNDGQADSALATVSITVIALQPDLLLRANDDANFMGDDVYSEDGVSQECGIIIERGKTDNYYLRVQNDGNTADSFTIKSQTPLKGWRVSYFTAIGNNDVTEEVTGASGWTTAILAPGSIDDGLIVQVTPWPSPAIGSTVALQIVVTSVTNSLSKDVGLLDINTIGWQPDLLLRANGDLASIGDNIYRTTGTAQSRSLSVQRGSDATYFLSVQNDGSAADSFIVKAAAAPAGWTVKYVTSTGNVDVTSLVTGDTGWTTEVVDSTAISDELIVMVSPDISTPIGARLTLSLTVTSSANNANIDVGQVVTIATGYLPDLWVRALGDAAYSGNNLYSIDGATQSRAISRLRGTTATYYLRVQNDGSAADTFTVKSEAAPAGWTVKYVSITGGVDVTAEVTGASGWSTGTLPAGKLDGGLYVKVTPISSIAPGAILTLTPRVTSLANESNIDVGQLVTTATGWQPDLWIRANDDISDIGNDVYSTNGATQSRELSVARGETATYYLNLQNDGSAADTFTVKSAAAPAGWTVNYFTTIGDVDVTAEVTGATGWSTEQLAAGALAGGLYVKVTPTSSVNMGAILKLTPKVTSDANKSNIDVGKLITTVAGWQPDLWVRARGEATYTGNNHYCTSGATQSKALTVVRGSTAIYYLRVQNDGSAADTFTLKSEAAPAGWTVKYYTFAGVDVTADVTGATGWSTGILAVGALDVGLYVKVTASSSVTLGDILTLTPTATSNSNALNIDVGQLVTTSGS